MHLTKLAALLAVFLSPVAALAAGGHDAVGCTGCHSLHAAKGEIIFAVAPNKKYLNPKTNQPYQGITALCLACHAETERGGQGYAPVSQHNSHPFGLTSVNPKVARVPAELLRDGGKFECLGCHDPHPSNPNHKYLRVSTGAKGDQMDAFCGVCHGSKAEGAPGKAVIFTSMDESRSSSVPLPPPPAAAKPAGKK
jgi:predicted CXXCH cytochrome family protein